MREQRLFVGEQQIVTGVELVSFREAEVTSQEIGHGAVEEPLPMQSPFAARRDQPVGRQHLQHVIPTRPFAALRQSLRPEPIEPQLPPQHARQPTGAPLARAAEPHLVETQPDDILSGRNIATIFGEEGERSCSASIFVEHLDGPAPSFRLRGIDLAEIEHMTLHHATVIETSVLNDAPVDVRLPVLSPLGLS
jgi:hypothetical protein